MRLKVGGMLLFALAVAALGLYPGAEANAAMGAEQAALASNLTTSSLSSLATIHDHHPGGALQKAGTSWVVFSYILKVVYYLAFTTLSGWVLWREAMVRFGAQETKVRDIGALLVRLYVLAYLGYAFVYLYDLQLSVNMDLMEALFGYVQGWSYLALGAAAFGGLFVLFRNRVLDLVWVVLLAAATGLGGHSSSYPMQWLTLPSYVIHWIAVSVWLGGVMFAVSMFRNRRDTLYVWLPAVSRAALWSVIALAFTGALHAVVYLPSAAYVYGTPWGRWLLIKLGAVALVLLISLFVRRAWKRRGAGIGRLLKIELSALALVLLVVGVLTSQHPTPQGKPLDWHVMGADIHMTLQITPNQPGTNSFVVKVWLPEEQTGPQSVTLNLQRGDEPTRSVSLTPVENEYTLSFPGFIEHRFRGQGAQLDRPGTWRAHVIVTDEHGKVTEYEREFEAW